MLMGLMTRMNAVSQRSNAQYALMQNHMNMMNAVRNLPFSGANMETLHQMDTNFALSNDHNQTQLMLATAQEQAAKELLAHEAKTNKISYIA